MCCCGRERYQLVCDFYSSCRAFQTRVLFSTDTFEAAALEKKSKIKKKKKTKSRIDSFPCGRKAPTYFKEFFFQSKEHETKMRWFRFDNKNTHSHTYTRVRARASIYIYKSKKKIAVDIDQMTLQNLNKENIIITHT